MTFTNFFLLDLIPSLIIFNMEERVSWICIQLEFLPFSPFVILPSTNVYALIFFPSFAKSIPSPLLVYLSWIVLQSGQTSIRLQTVTTYPPILVELSVVTVICWPPIFHVAKWHSPVISCDTSKRCVLKQSMIKHTHSAECQPFRIRMFEFNDSDSMWDSLPQSAYWKGHFDLFHLLNGSILFVIFVRMDHFKFEIWFKLEIALPKAIKVIIEWHQWLKFVIALLSYFSLGLLTLFYFFYFLRIFNMRVNTERIVKLIGLKVRNLGINLDKCVLDRCWGSLKLLNELRNFIVFTWILLRTHFEDRLFHLIKGLELIG